MNELMNEAAGLEPGADQHDLLGEVGSIKSGLFCELMNEWMEE